MSYTAKLTIKLHSTSTKTPEYRVFFNSQLPSRTEVTDDLVVCTATPMFGDNNVMVKLLNKEPTDTVIDSDNNIVEDLAVEIVQFLIDDLDFTHWIKNNSVYNDIMGVQQDTHGFMHTNGTLVFDFTCPGFYFLRNLAVSEDQILEPVIRHDNY